MNLKEAIYARRAVRQFTSEAVDEATIRQLVDAAIQAPSAVNEQPWSFVIVREQALLDRISHDAKAYLLRTTPVGLLSPHIRDLLGDPKSQIFYRAPVLILIASVVDSPWAVEDCTLAAQNLMLAARAAGLGTCWIGLGQKWLATPQGKAVLELPPDCLPIAPIIVGHPKAWPPAVPRNEPRIHWTG
jgi:nitroreductase